MKILDHYKEYKYMMDRTSLNALYSVVCEYIERDRRLIAALEIYTESNPEDKSASYIMEEYERLVRARDEIRDRLNR